MKFWVVPVGIMMMRMLHRETGSRNHAMVLQSITVVGFGLSAFTND